MSIVPSTPISFQDIQTTFGGENPISFYEYYKNSGTVYTVNVSGVPNVGMPISLSQFYGLTQYVPEFPTPVATTYVFDPPWSFGQTSYEWLSGVSGTNLTRTGGQTFNNIGTYGRYRTNFINNNNLILQAKAGDQLQFQVNNGAMGLTDTEYNSLWLKLGSGWELVQSVYGKGPHTATINKTLSSTLPAGNYGIMCYNNYSSAGNSIYASANFYSLHIVA